MHSAGIVDDAMASRRRVDDSDEEQQATALDLRPLSRSARPADPPPQPVRKPVIAARAVVVDDVSEDDGEATEFLSVRPASRAPPSSAPSPRALPSSVPLPSALAAEPRGHRRAVPIDASSSLATDSPSQAASSGPRPLPSRAHETVSGQTSTASVPRVTRIQVLDRSVSATADQETHGLIRADDNDVERTLPPDRDLLPVRPPMPSQRGRKPATAVTLTDDETQAPEELDPDITLTPNAASPSVLAPTRPPSSPPAAQPIRRVPLSAEGEPVPAPRASLRAPSPPQAPEQHDGVLVVEAPADASITVNGVDRGRGIVRISDLDRDARHAVRIHAPGFQPWSGSVSLQGKPAAKIRPTLKPRAR